MAIGREGHLAELESLDTGNMVVLRQSFVEEREIGRDEVRQAQVLAQQLVEKPVSLFDHRRLEHVIEFGVETNIRRCEVDIAQAQPLTDEVLRKRGRLRRVEQSLDLVTQYLRLTQLVL